MHDARWAETSVKMSSMTVELVILVGLQGAGKSTLVADRFSETHEVVSKDHWPNARHREARQLRVVEELLTNGRSVVVDNTNPGLEERAPLLQLAARLGVPARAIYLDVSLETARGRNSSRLGRALIPDVGLRATALRLVPPTIGEGFVSIEVIGSADEPEAGPAHPPAPA
jgi:predicted kinase